MYLENQLNAIGGIKFSSKVPTAGINLEQGMLINPDFYGSLNQTEQMMLVEHELLHLILKHHTRFDHDYAANVAADLAINSMLQKRFCGDKDPSKIIPTLYSEGCFPSKMGLPENQTAEWYLQALKSNRYYYDLPLDLGFGSKLDSKLGELEDKSSGALAGNGGLDTEVKEHKKKEKYSFDSYLQSLVGNKSYRSDFGYVERMGRSRRYDTLLPQTVLSEGDVRIRKNKVLLFLDFSGSCQKMIGDFTHAADQISKRLFDVVKFKFADYVVPFNDGGYGGGTNFENLRHEAAKHQYDMVWVFTDGEGSFYQTMKDADKWYWFLDGSCQIRNIPKGCKIAFLKQLKSKP